MLPVVWSRRESREQSCRLPLYPQRVETEQSERPARRISGGGANVPAGMPPVRTVSFGVQIACVLPQAAAVSSADNFRLTSNGQD